MNRKIFIPLFVFFSLLLIAACTNAEYNTQSDFVFDEQEFDFNTIKQSAGSVSHDFPFTYRGDFDVIVSGTPTSCACTSAKISAEKFRPGDRGILTVEFDPNLHAEPEGKFFKTASILTEPKLADTPEVKIWVEIDLDLGPEAFKLQADNHDDDEDDHDDN